MFVEVSDVDEPVRAANEGGSVSEGVSDGIGVGLDKGVHEGCEDYSLDDYYYDDILDFSEEDDGVVMIFFNML